MSISHPDHFVRIAQRTAENENKGSDLGALFANQFENTANYRAHLKTGKSFPGEFAGAVRSIQRTEGRLECGFR